MNNPPHSIPEDERQGELSNERVMTVFGEGLVTTEPNVAKVTIGAVTQDPNLTVAQQQNANIINQVIRAVMDEGIPREDIQTIDYSILPQYDYVEGVQQFRGYEVTHLLQVTIDEISKVGRVIDASVEAGANQVMNISFTVSHPEVFYQLGLSRAFEDAIAKAETLAETMNAELDPVPIKLVERIDTGPVPYQSYAQVQSVGGTPIEPGQLDINVRIEAQFRFMT